MKSFFRNLSACFPFFVRRPSALERAVASSPKSRRLRMEPLENRALLAVDAFGVAALSDVGESWKPEPAPAFSASELSTESVVDAPSPISLAAVVDVFELDATSAAASFSVQSETPAPVAPPSFERLMESLGMIEVESLGDESDVASLSFLDDATEENAATSDATVRRVVFEGSDVDAESLDEPIVVVPLVNADSANVAADEGSSSALTKVTVFECQNVSGGAVSVTTLLTPLFNSSDYELFMHCSFPQDDARNDFQLVSVVFDSSGRASVYDTISGGGSNDGYISVSGGTTFAVLPTNDSCVENDEVFQILFYTKPAGSGGNDAPYTPLANAGFEVTIVDDDQWKAQITPPQTVDVYEPRLGATAPFTEFALERVANETASKLQSDPLVNYALDGSYAMAVKLKFAFDNGAEPSDFRLEKYSSSEERWETVNLTQEDNNAYARIDIGVNQTQTRFRISGIADERIEGREAVIMSIDNAYVGSTDNQFEVDSTVVYSWIYESPEFRDNISELRVTDDSVNLGSLLVPPSEGNVMFDFASRVTNIAYSAGQTIDYVLLGDDAQYFEIDRENKCIRWKTTPPDNSKTYFAFVLRAFDVERANYLYDDLEIEFWTP